MKFNKIMMASVVLGAVFTLTGCNKLTKENYDQLEAGMKKSEVEALLGDADSCDNMVAGEGCTWGDEDKHIKVKFLADRVAVYSYKGL